MKNISVQSSVSLRDVLSILFRHQWKLIAFFSVCMSLAIILTLVMPKIYESESKLLIRVGRESVAMDPAVIGPTLGLSQRRENEVNSELAILKSRLLAERLVDKLGATSFVKTSSTDKLRSEAAINSQENTNNNIKREDLLVRLGIGSSQVSREKAIKTIMDSTDVTVENKSNIINLKFQAQSPQVAKEALEVLIDSYLEHHIEVHSTQASPQFFQEQADKLLGELTQKEDHLKKFQTEKGITAIDIQKDEFLARINRLQEEIGNINAQNSSSIAKINSLEKDFQGRSKTMETSRVVGKTNFAADAIKERLIELRLREADLSARYPDDTRILIDVREQIRLAENALEEEKETHTEITTAVDMNYLALELALRTERAQWQANKARKTSLEEKLALVQGELEKLLGSEMTVLRLQRDVDLLREEYAKYRANLQRAKISVALDTDKVSNISIVQPATLVLKAVKPKKMLNFAIGIFLGIFGGIGFVLFSEFLDDSIKTNDDIKKRLGIPVLVSVSKKEFESCT